MHTSINIRYYFLCLTIYSIAMGCLESAVVIYLRELYYPSGFNFPMVSMPKNIAFVEIIREASTLLMLLSVAYLAGGLYRTRVACFIYCFAIWDIFYYVFLYAFIGWPQSLLTWDILFLIPMAWTGPVLAPIIVSFTMILFAMLLLYPIKNNVTVSSKIFTIIALGGIIVFLSLIWDFSNFMLKGYAFSDLFKFDLNQLVIKEYIPSKFKWGIFISGEILIGTGLILYYLKIKTHKIL